MGRCARIHSAGFRASDVTSWPWCSAKPALALSPGKRRTYGPRPNGPYRPGCSTSGDRHHRAQDFLNVTGPISSRADRALSGSGSPAGIASPVWHWGGEGDAEAGSRGRALGSVYDGAAGRSSILGGSRDHAEYLGVLRPPKSPLQQVVPGCGSLAGADAPRPPTSTLASRNPSRCGQGSRTAAPAGSSARRSKDRTFSA